MALNITSGSNVVNSKRMKLLITIMEKALTESRRSIDCKEAVDECYGEDLSIFASPSNSSDDATVSREDARTMLANLVDENLELLNDKVLAEFQAILKHEGVNQKLGHLEQILNQLEEHDRREREAEEEEKGLAQSSMETVSLPSGVKASDCVFYDAFRVKKEERDKLCAEIADVDDEFTKIEQEIKLCHDSIALSIAQIQEYDNNMVRTADVCSMAGSGSSI